MPHFNTEYLRLLQETADDDEIDAYRDAWLYAHPTSRLAALARLI